MKINPNLYSLEVIYSAAYAFLNKAYILLDGNPEKEILVKLKSKSNEDPEKLGRVKGFYTKQDNSVHCLKWDFYTCGH